ncbi:MAG: hypothetical protein RLZZ301_232 [Bacteroidota bacterium]|jgi:hypothetical protein
MRQGLAYGIGFALLWIALKMLGFAYGIWLDHIEGFVLINMLLLTVAIALHLYRTKRKSTESNILTDIKSGLTAGLPYTIVVSSFLYFYYKDIYPGFNEQRIEAFEARMDTPAEIAALRKVDNSLENKSDEEIRDIARKNTAFVYNPQFTMSVSLLALLVYSTLNSLVIAVIFRRVVFRD